MLSPYYLYRSSAQTTVISFCNLYHLESLTYDLFLTLSGLIFLSLSTYYMYAYLVSIKYHTLSDMSIAFAFFLKFLFSAKHPGRSRGMQHFHAYLLLRVRSHLNRLSALCIEHLFDSLDEKGCVSRTEYFYLISRAEIIALLHQRIARPAVVFPSMPIKSYSRM